MASDGKSEELNLKQMEMQYKLQKKKEKQMKKEDKKRKALLKKQEKMKKRMEKSGQKVPDELIIPESSKKKEAGPPDQKIAQAEVVEFKREDWSRRSVQSLDEIEKKIDRFSGKGVKGLEARYREKYGEDLKVPELYQIETKLEMDQTIDRLAADEEKEEDAWSSKRIEEKSEEKSSFFSRSKKEAEVKVGSPMDDGGLNFLDLTTALFYVYKRWGKPGGIGAKIGTLIVEVIILPLLIIRIFTTIYYVRKRNKAKKAAEARAA